MNIKQESINLPLDFNEDLYYKLNPDVYNLNLLDAKFTASIHYIDHGYFENRKYKVELPSDFNEEIYYKLNPDVKEQNTINVEYTGILHYKTWGYFENRQYKVELPSDFDEEIYYLINPDVKEDFLKNPKKSASYHYLNYGYFEKKPYKIILINENKNLYNYLNNSCKNKTVENKNNTNFNKIVNDEHALLKSKLNYKNKIAKHEYALLKSKLNYENKIVENKIVENKIVENNTNTYFNQITNYGNDLLISKLNYENKIFVKLYNYDEDFINLKQKDVDLTKLYILIIDFPNLGGGTSAFLKMILSKYKDNVNFLIARNYNGYVKFTINDEYFIENSFNENESIDFINNIKNNITKIFINHLLDHTPNFLNFIYYIHKDISFITHDYFCITKSTQPFYEDINNLYSYIDIKIFNNIITQNQININTIGKYISEKQKIVVAPLPDFNNSGNYIQTNNDNIVIGIIGAISYIKGKDIVEILNDYILINKLNIDVVVFGEIYMKYKKNVYAYENINELNNLLIQYKPNILLETSIWPETYSYTLTLSKLTQLPILSLKKPFRSVVDNRLSDYEKVHYFSTINDILELIPKIKQNFFYTIEPTIYFNSFWDSYFNIPQSSENELKFINVKNKNIVLITSKIFVSKNSYSYADKRSVYTSEERFNQTLETINSIKKFIPNAYIVLFDNSKFDKNNYIYIMLKQNLDLLINITDNKELNYYTDEYLYRAFAEISQQIEFYNYFMKNIEIDKIKNFFKISGRYIINKNFNYSTYDNNKNIFKKNANVLDRDYFYTSFYKLDKSILKDYFNNLNTLRNNKENYSSKGYDFEVIVPNTIIDKISLVNNLGITQRIAVTGSIDDI